MTSATDQLPGPERGSEQPRQRASGRRPVEVVDVRTVSDRRRRRLATLLLAAVVLVAAAAGWRLWLEPRRQAEVVNAGFAELARTKPNITLPNDEVERLRWLAEAALFPKAFETPKPALAKAALELAAKRGSEMAWLDLGVLYRDGKLGNPDAKTALAIFDEVRSRLEVRVRAGDPSAMLIMGRLVMEGLGVPADQDKGIEFALRGAANGSANDKLAVGVDLIWGRGVFRGRAEPKRGLLLTEDAARMGNVDAMEPTASIYAAAAPGAELFRMEGIEGIDQTTSYEKARHWYTAAASAGRASAFANAGYYALAVGDLAEGRRWLEAAQKANETHHSHLLGLLQFINDKEPLNRSSEGIDRLASAYERGWFEIWVRADRILGLEHVPIAMRDRAAIVHIAFQAKFAESYRDTREVERYLSMRPSSIRKRIRSEALVMQSLLQGIGASSWVPVEEAQSAPNQKPASGSARFEDRSPPQKLSAPERDSAGMSRELTDEEVFGPQRASPDAVGKSSTPPQRPLTFVPFSGTLDAKGARDAEQQDRTGYVPGAPNTAQGGRSTFTVDNSRGGADAIARLYVNGKKPAVRSFFVKQGERFTATSLVPAVYALRYRYMGSEDTFEADQSFTLSEVEEPGGTRYSKVTVTLFSVRDGNLQTKRVSPDQF